MFLTDFKSFHIINIVDDNYAFCVHEKPTLTCEKTFSPDFNKKMLFFKNNKPGLYIIIIDINGNIEKQEKFNFEEFDMFITSITLAYKKLNKNQYYIFGIIDNSNKYIICYGIKKHFIIYSSKKTKEIYNKYKSEKFNSKIKSMKYIEIIEFIFKSTFEKKGIEYFYTIKDLVKKINLN